MAVDSVKLIMKLRVSSRSVLHVIAREETRRLLIVHDRPVEQRKFLFKFSPRSILHFVGFICFSCNLETGDFMFIDIILCGLLIICSPALFLGITLVLSTTIVNFRNHELASLTSLDLFIKLLIPALSCSSTFLSM